MSTLLLNRTNLQFHLDKQWFINIKNKEGFVITAKESQWLKNKLKTDEARNNFDKWLKTNNIKDKDRVEINFSLDKDNNYYFISSDNFDITSLKRLIIIQELTHYFLDKGFFVDLNPTAFDLSVYQYKENFNTDWETFIRYDLVYKSFNEELSISVGSEFTLMSRKENFQIDSIRKVVNLRNRLICNHAQISSEDPFKVIADKQMRSGIEGANRVIPCSYKTEYKNILDFLKSGLKDFGSVFFNIDKTGFKTVLDKDKQRIILKDNLMVFGGENKTVNAVVGMREYGPYKKIDNANDIKILFIYNEKDDANKVYQYLRNGLKQFPGLLTYVGIPVVLDKEKSLHYSSTEELPTKLQIFLVTQFPNNNNYNYAAIIIGPFSKYESDEKEENTYYEVKKLLLEKGISSQFIANKSVRSGDFNYYLPNIAIAILAKLGGIPWKLNTKKFNDLVIGYNYKKSQDQKWIGSAVFFDNEGRLGRIYGFSEAGAGEDLISHLKRAIDDYSELIGRPDRLTIHYYKPPRKDEIKNFEQIIYNKLNLDIPFALIEVNDTKSKSDRCFDTEYDMGMPESGTYVKIGKDEYLLFNNNRYEKEPVRKVKDELPVKVKIFYADTGGFSHREILSQIYEFSRLNWKGLMQTSQPVTIKYSKMIADFSLHFNGEFSENRISQKTPWFI